MPDTNNVQTNRYLIELKINEQLHKLPSPDTAARHSTSLTRTRVLIKLQLGINLSSFLPENWTCARGLDHRLCAAYFAILEALNFRTRRP